MNSDSSVPVDPALQYQEDYLWCLTQPEILDCYRGQVVVLHNRSVVGSGRDHLEALRNAESRTAERHASLPDRHELVFVVIPEEVWFDPVFFPPNPLRAGGGARPSESSDNLRDS